MINREKRKYNMNKYLFIFSILFSSGLFAQQTVQILTVCKEDVKKHCRWTVPGGGRIIKCLLKNEKNLSKQCLKTLNDI